MNPVAENLNAVTRTLPEGVRLVAVSKFHPVEALREAYDAGQRLFGESRVQELLDKRHKLPHDISWHFIGHLQTNKVRQLVGNVDMIESVDSDRLLRLIDKESAAAGVVSRVLMQVHVAKEDTKFGFAPEELIEWFGAGGYTSLAATHICGLMAMASNTDDESRVRADFHRVAELMARIKASHPDLCGFDILSMGMSHDYRLAIAEGATHVRVGSAIFGERQY
ncbi:MAG: YggS family pyridoxal phosphate-dependent enzyme [Muribaculaceae bacterium]|nr:YggS family pyridoxal phosphate-dependent enzyme [Muribaculaceae bacterium]